MLEMQTVPAFDIAGQHLSEVVRTALNEDAPWGDITTNAVVPASTHARAVVESAAEGVLAGMPVLVEVFAQLDRAVTVRRLVAEGSAILPGEALAIIEGPARPILTGERVALNFLQRLSGIATLTSRFVQAAAGTTATIVDTRKTTPGLRQLQRYAVRAGGGANHRMCLSDAVMIKDNHIAVAGGIGTAIERARRVVPHTMTITVECETLEQVSEATEAGADIVLLDNMDVETLREAVALIGKRAIAEASGGIGLHNVADVATTGVDRISIGALTHSAVALDMRLELTLGPAGIPSVTETV